MNRALPLLRRAASPRLIRFNASFVSPTRRYASRAFLLEDTGVGIPESERLSDLSTASRWRYAREAAEMAKERRELKKAAEGLKEGNGTQRSYSMAPMRAFYDRATPRKEARRKNWPDTPGGGESLMEPVWTVYGNFKAFVLAGIWVVLLLPALLGSLLLGEPPAEPSDEAIRAVLDAERQAGDQLSK